MIKRCLKGVIIIHPASGFPHVQFKRGEDVVSAIVLVDQLGEAIEAECHEVTFEILDHPYGPDIRADNGVARILKIL